MTKRDLTMVVPSHRRADRVSTWRTALPPEVCVLCVPEGQADDYRKHNPDVEIVTHPDSLLGITPKRMWIAEHFGDHVQVDDDQRYFLHMEHSVGEPECRLEPQVAYDVWCRLYENARELGVHLFSMSPYPDIRMYQPHQPFKLTGFVIGGKLGWRAARESGLWINPGIVAKDDYWLSALNAHKHRMALIDLRYASKFTPDFVSPGGQAGIRSQETERRDTEILKRNFGAAVRTKVRTPAAKGGSGHGDQVTLLIPF